MSRFLQRLALGGGQLWRMLSGATPTPSPAPTPTPSGSLKVLSGIGMNPDFHQTDYFGNGQPFLDRSKMSSGFRAVNGTLTVNEDGYPTSFVPDAGKTDARVEFFWNVDYGHTPASIVHRYVFRTTKTDWTIDTGGQAPISDTTTNGVRRVVFDIAANRLSPPQNNNSAYYATIYTSDVASPFVRGVDRWEIVRLDEEAALDAGEIFQSQFANRNSMTAGNRYMDWCRANDRYNLVGDPLPSKCTWANPAPVEVSMALSNKTGGPGWITIPLLSDFGDAIAYVKRALAVLRSDLSLTVELSNEVWNPQFGQFGQSEYIYQPPIPGGYSSYINYGYHAARLMTAILKGCGYDPRIKPFLGSQAGAAFVLDTAITGAKTAISEWSDPSNTAGKQNLSNSKPDKGAVYDAELAAKFQTFKSIFGSMGSAAYCDAGIGNPNASQADIATMQGWATGDQATGLNNIFRQLYHGDLIDSGGMYLANWQAFYAQEDAISVREGVPRIAYEGNVSPITLHTGEIANLWHVALHDPRMQQFVQDWLSATLTVAKFRAIMILADIAEQYSTFGCLENPYDLTTPRFAGAVAAQTAWLAGTLVAPTIPPLPANTPMFQRAAFFSTPFIGA